jgi:hypothetical protein
MPCVGSFGPITLGDCGPSSKVKVDVSSVTQNISRSIQDSVSSVSSKSIAVQNQNVSLKGSCCKPFKVAQGLSIKQADTSKFSADFATKTAKNMSDNISSAVDQSASQITGLLGSTTGPKLTAAIKQAVKKVSESSSFKRSVQTKMSETFGSQNQNISIDCGENIPTPTPPASAGVGDTGCYIDQNFVFEQVTNNLMETMMNDVMEDSQLGAIVAEAKQVSKTEGKGIDAVLDSVFGAYKWIIIAVIAGIILFIPLIIWAFKGKGSEISEAAKGVAEVAKSVIPTSNPVQRLARSWSRRKY